jgi:hypothetical protein
MAAPRQTDPPSMSVEDQGLENVLRAAHNFFQIRPATNHSLAKAGNPITEDSFERARKAFFKTGETKPTPGTSLGEPLTGKE